MPTNRRTIDGDGPDFYPTPAWATDALIDVEGDIIREAGRNLVWDPACGDFAMLDRFINKGFFVRGSDLYDRRRTGVHYDFIQSDFLDFERSPALGRPLAWRSAWRDGHLGALVTNPPYRLADQFVVRALDLELPYVAFLLRLSFLEGARRWHWIFKDRPPTALYVFSERITMYPNGEHTGAGGTTAYGWFVWRDAPQHEGIRWIAPGARSDAAMRKENSAEGCTFTTSTRTLQTTPRRT